MILKKLQNSKKKFQLNTALKKHSIKKTIFINIIIITNIICWLPISLLGKLLKKVFLI